MPRTTIYDSSGKIRYPADPSDLDSNREYIRDLFFNKVYVGVDSDTVDLNFYASTGTPEQFVGTVAVGHDKSPVRTAHTELSRVVEDELSWSMADRDASEGHRLFMSLPEISPREVSRYSIDSLIAATDGDKTVDLGTPDIDRAISVLHWLVQHTNQELSIAITENGRSAVVDDIDVVIVPGVTDDGVVGINGSDADIQRRFLESKATETIDALQSVIPQQAQPGRKSSKVRGNLKWLIDQVPGDEYVAETPDETTSRMKTQLKGWAPVFAVVGFVAAFVLGGGIDNLSAWWTTAVLGGGPVQLFTLTELASRLGRSPPAVSPRLLVGLGIVVVLSWIGIVVLLEKARLSAGGASNESDPYADDASRQFSSEMRAIFDDINNVPWADGGDLLNGLTSRPTAIPSNMRVRSRRGKRRERLLKVGVISVGLALAAGIVGYATGLYLPVLLGSWKPITETILIVGVLTFIAGVAWVIWNELLIGP